MIYESVLSHSRTAPDALAICWNGTHLSYRAFADAIHATRQEFARRQLTTPGVAVLAISNIQSFWICSLALRSLGVTTIVISCVDDFEPRNIPSLTLVVQAAHESWPRLAEKCAAAGVPLMPLPTAPDTRVLRGDYPQIATGGHLLFTSGTTGTPKMVLWDSAAEKDALRWGTEFNAATMYHVFDFGPWTAAGYFIPLAVWAHGGGIIVHQGPERYKALLHPDGSDALLLPYFLSEILRAPEGAFPRNERLKLYIGGGTVTADQLNEAKRRISPHVFNRLACTEVGGIACTPFNDPEDQRWHLVTPGRGIEIVDEHDEPVPIGQLGQLRVPVGAGPCGYYNDPEATTVFFRNGYFYPGDLAVTRSDGRIALQGRTTEVINCHGMKVAPAPYEDYLCEQFGLSGVCLFSAQDDQGEEQVYSVIETADPLDELLRHALEKKAFTNVELKVRTVAALPRTKTGKIIRNEVRAEILAAERSAVGRTE